MLLIALLSMLMLLLLIVKLSMLLLILLSILLLLLFLLLLMLIVLSLLFYFDDTYMNNFKLNRCFVYISAHNHLSLLGYVINPSNSRLLVVIQYPSNRLSLIYNSNTASQTSTSHYCHGNGFVYW